MEQFKLPSPLSLEGNLSESQRFELYFELYLKATEADKKDEQIRVAILLHCVGEDGLEVFNTFQFENKEITR